MYEKEFMSDEQIAESKKPAGPVNKHLADYIRRKLSKGYAPGSRFLQVLAAISDADLIEKERTFTAEKSDHLALTALYKNRLHVEKAATGVTSFENLCKKAEKASDSPVPVVA